MPHPAAHCRQVLAYQASSPPSDSSGGRANGSSTKRRACGASPVAPVAPTAILRNSRRERGWVMARSLVARHAVRQASHLLLRLIEMTLETPAHVHPNDRASDAHPRHVSMTGFAVQAGCQMGLVAEEDEVRLGIDTDPGNSLALRRIGRYRLDLRLISGDHGTAPEAFLDRRDPCRGCAQRSGVTVEA